MSGGGALLWECGEGVSSEGKGTTPREEKTEAWRVAAVRRGGYELQRSAVSWRARCEDGTLRVKARRDLGTSIRAPHVKHEGKSSLHPSLPHI